MLFTSLHWLLFLPAAFIVYHLCPPVLRRWVMLGASIYFYASWNAKYLLLIAGQIGLDWLSAWFLSRTDDPRLRKLCVGISVTVALSVLGFFKYYGFFAGNLSVFGVQAPALDIILPLAISFYTFESMSYVIDVYRREMEPVKSPLHLALFVMWFPHLIAGPIIRPSQLIGQLKETRTITQNRFFSGLVLMGIGYAKKVLLADWLAKIVEPGFANPEAQSSLTMLIVVYAYAFQIYLDFSAYTDIARGASRWFGIELPENFNDPYLATSITDFWRRWHMTLSTWLRDYLYIPLGGNRLGGARTYVNLMATMLLGGLWHGASWNFVMWGGLHGAYLAIERKAGVSATAVHTGWSKYWRQFLTFHLVCVAWVFFRAQDFGTAWKIFAVIGQGSFWLVREQLLASLGAVLLIAIYWLAFPARRPLEQLNFEARTTRAQLVFGLSAFVLFMMTLGASTSEFIYFQF